jgi:hypothetical protein
MEMPWNPDTNLVPDPNDSNLFLMVGDVQVDIGRRTPSYRVFVEDTQFDYEGRFSLFPFHSLNIFTSVHE